MPAQPPRAGKSGSAYREQRHCYPPRELCAPADERPYHASTEHTGPEDQDCLQNDGVVHATSIKPTPATTARRARQDKVRRINFWLYAKSGKLIASTLPLNSYLFD